MSADLRSTATRRPDVPRVIEVASGDDLLRLARVTARPCVSLYVPRRVRDGDRRGRDRVEQLVDRAVAEVAEMCGADATRVLDPIRTLPDDRSVWSGTHEAVAVLVDPDGAAIVRIPEHVDELLVVADGFHLKPLLATSSDDAVFHILALSIHEARLLRANRRRAVELSVPGMPRGFSDAAWRSDATSSAGTDDVEHYLSVVDSAVAGQLSSSPTMPLVLAGPDDLLADYRRVSRHPEVLRATIGGSPDQHTTGDLHRWAWELVETSLDRARREARERFLNGGERSLFTVAAGLAAAAQGRIGSIFVPTDVEFWGRFDRTQPSVVEHDHRRRGDRDLADLAAIETLRHGGTVIAVPRDDIPGHGEVAASLRS